jgi:hypothetical protein
MGFHAKQFSYRHRQEQDAIPTLAIVGVLEQSIGQVARLTDVDDGAGLYQEVHAGRNIDGRAFAEPVLNSRQRERHVLGHWRYHDRSKV